MKLFSINAPSIPPEHNGTCFAAASAIEHTFSDKGSSDGMNFPPELSLRYSLSFLRSTAAVAASAAIAATPVGKLSPVEGDSAFGSVVAVAITVFEVSDVLPFLF